MVMVVEAVATRPSAVCRWRPALHSTTHSSLSLSVDGRPLIPGKTEPVILLSRRPFDAIVRRIHLFPSRTRLGDARCGALSSAELCDAAQLKQRCGSTLSLPSSSSHCGIKKFSIVVIAWTSVEPLPRRFQVDRRHLISNILYFCLSLCLSVCLSDQLVSVSVYLIVL